MKAIYLNPLENVINLTITRYDKRQHTSHIFCVTVSQIIVRYISNYKIYNFRMGTYK